MHNHYFDVNGAYVMSTEAYDWAICPPDALRIPLPDPVPEGFWPVVNQTRDGWDMVEDHRGEEGYIDGEPVRIAALGPLPEGWTTDTPIPPDTRTQVEKRRAAYMAEADPLFREAQYYAAEAEGLRLLERLDDATHAEAKAREFLRAYALKKEEIRARFPDAGPDLYRLNATGTYHESSCSYASGDGTDLSLEDIRIMNPAARPCSRCNPPPLDGEVAVG